MTTRDGRACPDCTCPSGACDRHVGRAVTPCACGHDEGDHSPERACRMCFARCEQKQPALVSVIAALAAEWPIGVCAHRCFREDPHIAPKDCLHGPDWLLTRGRELAEQFTADCQPSGCGCVGHRFPGVSHMVPCCDQPHIEDAERTEGA